MSHETTDTSGHEYHIEKIAEYEHYVHPHWIEEKGNAEDVLEWLVATINHFTTDEKSGESVAEPRDTIRKSEKWHSDHNTCSSSLSVNVAGVGRTW